MWSLAELRCSDDLTQKLRKKLDDTCHTSTVSPEHMVWLVRRISILLQLRVENLDWCVVRRPEVNLNYFSRAFERLSNELSSMLSIERFEVFQSNSPEDFRHFGNRRLGIKSRIGKNTRTDEVSSWTCSVRLDGRVYLGVISDCVDKIFNWNSSYLLRRMLRDI